VVGLAFAFAVALAAGRSGALVVLADWRPVREPLDCTEANVSNQQWNFTVRQNKRTSGFTAIATERRMGDDETAITYPDELHFAFGDTPEQACIRLEKEMREDGVLTWRH
jgi:hypothetical protein